MVKKGRVNREKIRMDERFETIALMKSKYFNLKT